MHGWMDIGWMDGPSAGKYINIKKIKGRESFSGFLTTTLSSVP